MRRVLRVLLTIGMVGVGIMHFVKPEGFVRIIPSFLPWPLALVYASGVFEIALGAAILVPRARRLASYGLAALYIAVFPANINMAVNHIRMGESEIPPALLWLRLPLQAVFILWALYAGRTGRDEQQPS